MKKFVGSIQVGTFLLLLGFRSKHICGMKKGHKDLISQRKERYTLPRRGENIRKRKDGRWEARFPKGKDAGGRTIYGAVYGATYKEAKEKRYLVQDSIQSPTISGTGVLLHELLSLWIADSQVRLKASTVYRYQYLIDTHILPELGDKSLDSVTSPVINSFLASKMQNGRLDGSGGLSAAYVRSISLVISSALKFGAEQGICSAVSTKIKKPVLTPKELPVLSVSQQNALENTLLTGTDETKLGVYISLYTGLRIGEICALTWDDVDLKKHLIYVRKTVVRVKSDSDSKTHLIIDSPKTASSLRCIPICSNLYVILSDYQTEDGPWSLGEAVYNRLKEKEQIMLDAIDNHVLEAMPTSNEDLEIIFSKFK